MMKICIIDYGSGNLRSAEKAFEHALSIMGKGKVLLTNNPNDLVDATHIVLPGQGAFASCRVGLDSIDGMVDQLNEQVLHQQKPFLGICVGMQLLATYGREFSDTNGLDWIPGKVVKLEVKDNNLKIPHMGWNSLNITNSSHPFLNGIETNSNTYFVHSYHFSVQNKSNIIATVHHGLTMAAIVTKNNIIGTQFHPEKSQSVGLRLISNFIRWRP